MPDKTTDAITNEQVAEVAKHFPFAERNVSDRHGKISKFVLEISFQTHDELDGFLETQRNGSGKLLETRRDS